MSISAARFVDPGAVQRYDLVVRVPEHTDPNEWIPVLEQIDAHGVTLIQGAPLVPVEPETVRGEEDVLATTMNTVTAARFYGPYHEITEGGSGQGPALYDLNVKVAETDDPTAWLTVLGQVGMGSVNTIKNARVETL